MHVSNEGPGPIASQRLAYLLKRAERRMNQLHSVALAPFGIDARELGILQMLGGCQPLSQTEAAARLRIDRTTMVAMLDVLEGKGLLSRQPHPGDRRRNVIELSAAGRTALRSATEASDEAERALLSELDPTAAASLRDALRTISAGEAGAH
jgi:DNA-binding MarR family transcriptional regulator